MTTAAAKPSSAAANQTGGAPTNFGRPAKPSGAARQPNWGQTGVKSGSRSGFAHSAHAGQDQVLLILLIPRILLTTVLRILLTGPGRPAAA